MITPFFNMLTDEASLRSAVQGAIDGALITILVGGYLLLLRDGRFRSWFRRLGFSTDLGTSAVWASAADTQCRVACTLRPSGGVLPPRVAGS